MRHRIFSLIVLLLLAGCLPRANEVVIATDILIGGDVNARDEIEDPQLVFPSTHQALYAHVFTEGILDSAEITGAWWFLGDGTEEERKVFETRVEVTRVFPVAKFMLKSTKEWPKGTYRFSASHEGKALIDEEFSME